MIVNQWVPAAHKGDAIGDSARRVRDLLRAHGPRVRALRADDRRRSARTTCGRSPIRRRGAATLTIFHFALPSPMTEAFASLAARARAAVSQRHAGVVSSRPTIRRCSAWPSLGREELATLVGRVDLALGDSDYNRQELEALGFAPHRRLPDRRRHRRASPSRPTGRRSTRSSTTARELPVRRPDRAEQEDRGSSSGWPSTTSATSTPTTASSSSAGSTWCRGTIR